MKQRLEQLLKDWREGGQRPDYRDLAALLVESEYYVSPAPHEPTEAQ